MASERLDDRRLLAAPVRRVAALLAAVCAAVSLALAVVFHGDRSAGPLDSRLFAVLPYENPAHSLLGQVIKAAPLVALGIAVLTTTGMLLVGRWRDAVFTAAGPGLTMLVVEAGKRLVDRTIDGHLALPSGHTAGITSVALALAVLLLQRVRERVVPAAVLGWLGATLLGGAMALVMITARYHYPTDTLAGYCAALATTLGVAFVIDRLTRRSVPSRPPALRLR